MDSIVRLLVTIMQKLKMLLYFYITFTSFNEWCRVFFKVDAHIEKFLQRLARRISAST